MLAMLSHQAKVMQGQHRHQQQGQASKVPNLFWRSYHQDALRQDASFVALPPAEQIKLCGMQSFRYVNNLIPSPSYYHCMRSLETAWAIQCRRFVLLLSMPAARVAGTFARAAIPGTVLTQAGSQLGDYWAPWAGAMRRQLHASACTGTWWAPFPVCMGPQLDQSCLLCDWLEPLTLSGRQG